MSMPQAAESSPQPIWSKRVSDQAGEANVRYCAGRDVAPRPPADSLLVTADLWTNRAHAVMLVRQGILRPVLADAIFRALDDIERRHADGQFHIPPESEDVHMAIEQEVTRQAGPDAGGWLHSGRSRNDQTTTDIRLWLRSSLLDLYTNVCGLVEGLATHAEAHLETVCPGFTHMQPAMVTTWGHLVGGWGQGLLRDTWRLQGVYQLADRSPLGAAASFGTSWPIDRELTARLLGFQTVQECTVDCISSRGEAETQAVFAFSMLMNRLAGIGQDLILLSTPPRTWVRLDNRFVTGSSIMPQKRNPDFAEVTRAKAALVTGICTGLLGIGRAAPAGYNRDTQWTKYMVMDAFAEIVDAPEIFRGVFHSLAVDTRKMRQACQVGFMNATDAAELLAVKTGLPFRACYRAVGQAVSRCEKEGVLRRGILNQILRDRWKDLSEGIEHAQETPFQFDATLWKTLGDPLGLVQSRNQTGSPHPEQMRRTLESIRETIHQLRRWHAQRRIALDRAKSELAREIDRIQREVKNATS